jgi:hypothetical protein
MKPQTKRNFFQPRFKNKIVLILLFSCAFNFMSYGQQVKNSTIKIDGFGKIDLPVNMEIQGGQYKIVSEYLLMPK